MNGRVYLRVPYREIEAAKTAGARFDPDLKRWYVPRYVGVDAFARWLPPAPAVTADKTDGHGCHNTATANLVVPQVVAYQGPCETRGWKFGGQRGRLR